MIGERLSEIRKDHGDTQATLAEKLNVSIATIRSWEQEKSSPSHEMLITICQLYQVSSDFLLGLSNVDPFFSQQNLLHHFSEEELLELRDYEKYLIWKRKQSFRK